tara:strand:- start:263 stop:475 length:213 start_codon:yes stop_codon:yes gene_type:complete
MANPSKFLKENFKSMNKTEEEKKEEKKISTMKKLSLVTDTILDLVIPSSSGVSAKKIASILKKQLEEEKK